MTMRYLMVEDAPQCNEACKAQLKTPVSGLWARCSVHASWWTVTEHPDTQERYWVKADRPPQNVIAAILTRGTT